METVTDCLLDTIGKMQSTLGSNIRWSVPTIMRFASASLAIVTIVTCIYMMTSVQQDLTPKRSLDNSESIKSIKTLIDQLSSRDTPEPYDTNWDKRDWKNFPEKRVTAIRKLYLVRHGQYEGPNGQLTELGREQAEYTGKRLAQYLGRMGVDGAGFRSITHSSMIRAEETARIISASLPNVPVYMDDILKEGGPVKPDPTVSFWSLPDRQFWEDGPRMEAAYRRYFHRQDPGINNTAEIIVAHGNMNRYCILRSLQLRTNAWFNLYLPHASITQVVINPDSRVSVGPIGDAGHIPLEKQTG
ncbi:unnamed protein product [Owenia fusiformis]|uniref:Serine/threonine-protein phosphatase PGAM5, mitochondrial n=1 Tax=Owenia fusiformis TaxID=6347 RepID=A0A8S4Q3D6_OWEFU|nr:unnamed protein product [Owenia fusiformis]